MGTCGSSTPPKDPEREKSGRNGAHGEMLPQSSRLVALAVKASRAGCVQHVLYSISGLHLTPVKSQAKVKSEGPIESMKSFRDQLL